jgi:hypothetical protein
LAIGNWKNVVILTSSVGMGLPIFPNPQSGGVGAKAKKTTT